MKTPERLTMVESYFQRKAINKPIKLEILEYLRKKYSDRYLKLNPNPSIEIKLLNWLIKVKRPYKEIVKLLNTTIKKETLSPQSIPFIKNNVLKPITMPIERGGFSAHDFMSIKMVCWYNNCNFNPGESVRIINYFETEKGLSPELTNHIFSFIDYYPMTGSVMPFTYIPGCPNHFLYMVSDPEITEDAKLWLKQNYYNECITHENSEKLEYICPEIVDETQIYFASEVAQQTALTVQQLPLDLISSYLGG